MPVVLSSEPVPTSPPRGANQRLEKSTEASSPAPAPPAAVMHTPRPAGGAGSSDASAPKSGRAARTCERAASGSGGAKKNKSKSGAYRLGVAQHDDDVAQRGDFAHKQRGRAAWGAQRCRQPV